MADVMESIIAGGKRRHPNASSATWPFDTPDGEIWLTDRRSSRLQADLSVIEPASPNASEALHYSAPTGCARQSGERPPFNVNLPVFTPGREKEHEEWNAESWEILD